MNFNLQKAVRAEPRLETQFASSSFGVRERQKWPAAASHPFPIGCARVIFLQPAVIMMIIQLSLVLPVLIMWLWRVPSKDWGQL